MADITTSTVTNIADPKLAAIAARVANTFKLAAEKAAAHQADAANFPIPADPNSAEQMFLTRMQRMPTAKMAAAAQKGLTSANAAATQRSNLYGDLAKVNLRSATPVADQVSALEFPVALKFDATHLSAVAEIQTPILVPNMPIVLTEPAKRGLQPQQALNALALRVHKVKCVEETTWETGDDEIALGGVTVDAFGFSHEIGESMVSENFNEGVERVYSPPLQFARFDLTKNGAGEDLYAAIFKKESGPPMQARHGLTRTQFQQSFADLGAQGYRLIDVSGYASNGQDLYAAIWEKSAGPAYIAHHAMSRAEYQATFTDLNKQGYRLTRVSGYGLGGQDLYAAIWQKVTGPAYEAHHAMSAADFQKRFDDLDKQGFRLMQISAYSIDAVNGKSQDLYACIWEKSSGPASVARFGMTSAEYQTLFSQLGSQGFVLTDISGYSVGDSVRYAAIFQKTTSPAWIARHGLTRAEYQKVFNDLGAKGFRLVQVDGYTAWPKFPRSYFATLVIAEKNDGGFADFLQKLWDMVKDQVVSAIAAAIGAWIGTDIFPGIGTIIGAAVGWVVGEIFNLIKSIFSDWVFAPGTAQVTIPTLNARWAGGATSSSQGMFQYEGYGGTYQLTCDWALVP